MAVKYYLKGEIDSSNAKEFEENLLEAYEKNGELVLDASELEYMTSSGIRALVKLFKLQGNMRIDNVSDAVFSIFHLAGITEMFAINRQALELTNDNWEIAGYGASGTVYKINADTGIKVYKEGIDFDLVNQERELARQAFISGVPTIIPNRTAKVDGRNALLFELVNSSSLGEMLTDNPDQFESLMDDYIAMIKSLHSTEDVKGYFSNLQDLWLESEHMIRQGLRDEDADLVIDIYKNSLRSKNLLHGDIHPGNVLMNDGELMLVDMATISTGPDIFDVMTVYRLSKFSPTLGRTDRAEKSLSMKREMFDKFWDAFARRYYNTNDQATLDEISRQLYLVGAIDFLFAINTAPPEVAYSFYADSGNKIMDEIIKPNKEEIRKIFAEGKLNI